MVAIKSYVFDEQWPQLQTCCEKIMNLQELSKTEWRDGMEIVYRLCLNYTSPSVHKIYQKTQEFIQDLVTSRREEIFGSVDLLGTYERRWKEYRDGIALLHIFLGHVNRYYVNKMRRDALVFVQSNQGKTLDIHELGLQLWKRNLLEMIGDKLSWFLLEQLKNDRKGTCSNPGAVQAVIKSLFEVGASDEDPIELYRKLFENRFLSESGECYRIRVDEEIQNADCSQYMKKALHWMSEEILRSNKFLHSSTIPKVRKECLKRMVLDRMEYLQAECKKMISQEVEADYRNIYALLKPTETGLDAFASELQEHITQIGCAAMTSVVENNPELFVDTFLQVREKYLNIIKRCFDSDKKFIAALDEACVTILKCDGHKIFPDKSPEVLATYCDVILKKNARATEESLVEDALSQAVIVFNYIQQKDVFQKMYSQMLCKRLLRGPEQSLYVEEIMIAKLKQTCGHEFTRKYQDMVTDTKLKRSLNDEFSAMSRDKGAKLGFGFEAAILRTSSWPTSGVPLPFAVPQVLEKCITEFESFYYQKHTGRKLVWLHHMSSAELKLCYLPKTYVVTMTTYQMALLLLFEKTDTVTQAEVKESTNLDDIPLGKVIRSLTEAKLLIADGRNSDTDESNNVYHLNRQYSNRKLKFKIPAVAKNDRKAVAQQELQNIRQSADDSRKFALEAAIVRVMKARKTLKHNALIQEVIKQVAHLFVPKIALIKKCIGGLIDRAYLQRNPDCTNEYEYLA